MGRKRKTDKNGVDDVLDGMNGTRVGMEYVPEAEVISLEDSMPVIELAAVQRPQRLAAALRETVPADALSACALELGFTPPAEPWNPAADSRFVVPPAEPLPDTYSPRPRRSLVACEKCRRLRHNNGAQAVCVKSIQRDPSGGGMAYFRCTACGHRFKLPIGSK